MIEMRFTLLGKKNELMIFAPTNFIGNNLSKNIVHIALKVNNRAEKNYQAKNNI